MSTNENSYCQALFQLASAANSSRSHTEIIHSIVKCIAEAMGAKGCSLMFLTPDKKTLLHTASFGLSDWFVRKGPVQIDDSMIQTLAGNVLPVLDAAGDERVQYHKQIKQEGIASVLNVPIYLREKVVGVMRVYNDSPRQFSVEDIKFASMAANFGAMAMEAAHCHISLKQDYDTFRQDMLQWRSELDYESMVEPAVMPFKEAAIAIPPGG